MRVLKLVAVLVVALLLACGDPFAPVGAMERMVPPPEYAGWYAATAICAGRSGDFAAITWELTDSIASSGREVLGVWEPPHLIRLRREYRDVEYAVKHEMLHDLLQTTAHPAPPFGTCEYQP